MTKRTPPFGLIIAAYTIVDAALAIAAAHLIHV